MNLAGHIVPLALGVAASPLPVIAVLIILLTPRARVGSIAFASAWVLGNAVAITIAVAFAETLRPPKQGLDLPFEGVIMALLGLGLVVAAVLSRRGRLRSEDPSAAPRWVASVDHLSPWGGALVAFTNATTSPKNLALAVAAGLAIRNASRLAEVQTAAAVLYVAVASVSVLTPVVIYFVAGDRAKPILARWKREMTARAAATVEITVFVLGMALAVRGLSNLLG